MVAAVFISTTMTAGAASVINQYFPMNNGDSRFYQDYDVPDNTTTENFAQITYNGHQVFSLSFHDEWNTTYLSSGTWYLNNSGTALALYGINTAWGNLSFTSPANLMTDQSLTNNGTITSHVKGLYYLPGYGNVTMDITIKATISSVGTITVPAGTFKNCKQLLVVETATLNGVFFNNYDSAAWVLAPGVGIIDDGVATWDVDTGTFNFYDLFGNEEDYFELVSGSIKNLPIDYIPPSNPLYYPANGAQLYVNPTFIYGIASDAGLGGSGIKQVLVNGNPASNDFATGNGSAVWSTYINLAAGSDTITVVATDGAGNNTTNFLSVVEMLPAPTLTTQPTSQAVAMGANVSFGVLAVSPLLPMNYQWRKDGTILRGATNSIFNIVGVQTNQAGNYSVVITNLSGSITSSTALLFVDNKKPTISIKSPIANARLANSVVEVSGIAGDNGKVLQVIYRLNNDGWLSAVGTSNWQSGVVLMPGTNIFRVYSVDWVGNISATNSENIFYVDTTRITIQTNGNGTISPNWNLCET